jgi:hypothetical protein
MAGVDDERGRRGFALVTVLLALVAVAALVVGALVVSASHILSDRAYVRQTQLEHAAASGIELGRARLNADRSLFPDTGYAVLEEGALVADGAGGTLPGVRRWLYAGPAGNVTGQYGLFGSLIAVARDEGGGVVVRRGLARQESFARYAYFTDVEPAEISFGAGDEIWGPVHSNDDLRIYPSGAAFRDEVRSAGTISGAEYARFDKGFEAGVAAIPLPETTELARLEALASSGGVSFADQGGGGYGEADLRIEFMGLDLDGDGSATGEDEGFFRVYRSNTPNSTSAALWVSGDAPVPGDLRDALHCGHYEPENGPYRGAWRSAAEHGPTGSDSKMAALSNSRRRCYLGGSDSIFGGFRQDDGIGSWVPFLAPGEPVDPRVSDRADARFLFPLSRALNPDFRGVVFVDGKVVISGVVRGRLTIAATEQIIIGDDITYAGGIGSCEDVLGLFSGQDVVVADNALNAPQLRGDPSNAWFGYDDTQSEFVHAVVLALGVFTVEDFASGSTREERCEGALWGRGCLYLTGGVIQRTRGAVGTITSPGGTGYVERYSYDRCGATDPPPYFPTTGHFLRDQVYPVDPVGFEVGRAFALQSSGG